MAHSSLSRSRRCLAVLLLLLACAAGALHAQQDEPGVSFGGPPPPAEKPKASASAPRFTVSGTVTNSVTGEPLRRVLVTVPESSAATMTDTSGRYDLRDVLAGTADITFQKPGYFSPRGSLALSRSIKVTAETPRFAVALVPGATLTGRVVDAEERPVAGAQVRVQSPGGFANYGRQTQQQAISDERGRFRFAQLPSGAYYLVLEESATPRLWRSTDAAHHEVVWPNTYYPGVPEIAQATLIQLAPGASFDAVLTARMEPVYKVSATLVGGGEFTQLHCRRVTGDETAYNVQFPVHGNKVAATLPAGSYVALAVNAESRGGNAAVEFEVTRDVSDLRLPLLPLVPIPLKMHIEASGRQTSAVNPADESAPIIFFLQPAYEPNGMPAWQDRKKSAFPAVDPGTYRLRAELPHPWRMKSATQQTTDLLHEPLVVHAGASPAPIEVTLVDDAATLEIEAPWLTEAAAPDGTADSGDAEERVLTLLNVDESQFATAAILPAGDDTAEAKIVPLVARVSGAYAFAPGDYLLVVLDPLDLPGHPTGESLAPYLSSAQKIHLDPYGSAHVIAMRPAASKD